MRAIHKHFFFAIFFTFLFTLGLFTSFISILTLGLTGGYMDGVVVVALAIPVFFIFANVLYRYTDNILTRSLYVSMAYCSTIFTYWFIGSVLLALLYVFGLVDVIEIPVIIYVLATLLAALGIAQAFVVKVTSYTLKTPAMYPQLSGKKIVLVADTHFGPINQEMFAKRIFKKILDQKPDVVLFSGDMFDSEVYKDVDAIVKEIKILTSHVPVFFTPGNHEQYGAYNHFIEMAWDGGMTVLADESVHWAGVPIFGLNYKQTKNIEAISKLINTMISPNHPSIVLNHEPVFHDMLEKAGAFLVVSGHTHKGQFWPFNLLTRAFYGRYHYGFHTVNTLTSVTTAGAGTWGPPMRTFNPSEIVSITFN